MKSNNHGGPRPGSGRPPGAKSQYGVGFAKYVRDNTNQGQELADFMLKVFRGDHTFKITKNGDETELTPTIDQRIEACDWLTSRGFGKPVEVVEATVDTTALEGLTGDERTEVGKALLALHLATLSVSSQTEVH